MTSQHTCEVSVNPARGAAKKLPHNGIPAIFRLKQLSRSLKPETRKAFRSSQVKLSFPGPSVLFGEGDISRGIYVVNGGEIKLSMFRGRTKGVQSRLARRGEILGLGPTVSGRPYEVTAEALGPCQVSFVPSPDFMRLMQQDSEFAFHVIHHLCADIGSVFRSVRFVRSQSRRGPKNNGHRVRAASAS
jgi:CRP-like cAMP-binding protein